MRWTLKSDSGGFGLLKSKKGIAAAILCLVAGILLLAFSGGGTGKGAKTDAEKDTLSAYLDALETETASLCSSVRGVGKCRVMITLSSGEETVYRGGSKIGTTPPRVQSVTLVCEGGDSDRVRREMSGMLSALFDIGENRVTVLKLK